jgi:hypothetical protein
MSCEYSLGDTSDYLIPVNAHMLEASQRIPDLILLALIIRDLLPPSANLWTPEKLLFVIQRRLCSDFSSAKEIHITDHVLLAICFPEVLCEIWSDLDGAIHIRYHLG